MNACGMLGEYTMVVGHLENGEVDGDNIKMDCWEIRCDDWRRVELAQDNLTLESSRLCIISCNIKKFYILLIECIYVFCMGYRADSSHFHLQHYWF